MMRMEREGVVMDAVSWTNPDEEGEAVLNAQGGLLPSLPPERCWTVCIMYGQHVPQVLTQTSSQHS